MLAIGHFVHQARTVSTLMDESCKPFLVSGTFWSSFKGRTRNPCSAYQHAAPARDATV